MLALKYALANFAIGIPAMTASHTGGCLCGAVRYTVDVPVTALRACHCKNCQRASGSGGTVNAVVPSDSLNPQVIHEIDSANRGRFSLVNGYGTNLTFDFSNENGYSPIPAISIVVKAVEACGHELGKLTDNFAKANGSPATIARLRRLTGNLADTASSELRS